mmetsp:Transcript_40801/g.46782  ORF Transcript_40801/g.46782 Transcript_40801/m.46782 type:complete len:246 (-) Transcript_40801:656-1393(-)
MQFEIRLATKTKSLVEHQQSFSSQVITIALFHGIIASGYSIYIGAEGTTVTSKFTGFINMFLFYNEAQSSVEMLSNSHRNPIEFGRIYEPNLAFALIVKDYVTADYVNKFYDYAHSFSGYTTGTDSSTVQLVSFATDKVNVCYSYIKHKCKSVDSSNSPKLFVSNMHFPKFINLAGDGSLTLASGDKIVPSTREDYLKYINSVSKSNTATLFNNGLTYDGTSFSASYINWRHSYENVLQANQMNF